MPEAADVLMDIDATKDVTEGKVIENNFDGKIKAGVRVETDVTKDADVTKYTQQRHTYMH